MKKKLQLAIRYLVTFTISLVLLSFFDVTESSAQGTITGSFVGTVVDADTNNFLENVVVQFTNEASKSTTLARTDSKGNFRKATLLPGEYIIEIAAPFYRTQILKRILYATRTNEIVPVPIRLTSLKQSNITSTDTPLQTIAKKPISAVTVPNIIESRLSLGKYYALVIGNNDYQYVKKLKFAKTDAQSIAAVLQDKFGFETKLILDSTRQAIISEIYNFRKTLSENDNLLIYYSGHGFYDPDIQEAYWIPVDARTDDNSNWISANDITKNIKGIKAKHVLVVSDSCYSGTIDRQLDITEVETATGREKFLQKIAAGKSRTLMASVGNEPVADGGGGKYSVFANAFLIALDKMESNVFTADEMFRNFVQEHVAGNSDQVPEYNFLKNSGHESGDFVFIRKKESK